MFAHQYINMCKEAKEDLEYIRIFNSTPREERRISLMQKFTFKRGDSFHHPEMGEDKTKKVAQDNQRNLRALDDPRPFRKEDCIWIPTVDQLMEEASRMVFSIPSVFVLKKLYEGSNFEGLSDEERVLAYFMEHHEKKIWDFDNQKWVEI